MARNNALQPIIDAYHERKKEEEKAQVYIGQLENQINQHKGKMEEYAKAGNLEAYKKEKAAMTDCEDELYVLRNKTKADTFISREEGLKAWKKYCPEYEKELASLTAEYRKEAEKLLDKFLEIVEIQNQALEAREKLAEACGIRPHDQYDIGNFDPFPEIKMKFFEEEADNRFNGVRVWQPSAKWFLIAGISRNPEKHADLFNDVLRCRKSHKD